MSQKEKKIQEIRTFLGGQKIYEDPQLSPSEDKLLKDVYQNFSKHISEDQTLAEEQYFQDQSARLDKILQDKDGNWFEEKNMSAQQSTWGYQVISACASQMRSGLTAKNVMLALSIYYGTKMVSPQFRQYTAAKKADRLLAKYEKDTDKFNDPAYTENCNFLRRLSHNMKMDKSNQIRGNLYTPQEAAEEEIRLMTSCYKQMKNAGSREERERIYTQYKELHQKLMKVATHNGKGSVTEKDIQHCVRRTASHMIEAKPYLKEAFSQLAYEEIQPEIVERQSKKNQKIYVRTGDYYLVDILDESNPEHHKEFVGNLDVRFPMDEMMLQDRVHKIFGQISDHQARGMIDYKAERGDQAGIHLNSVIQTAMYPETSADLQEQMSEQEKILARQLHSLKETAEIDGISPKQFLDSVYREPIFNQEKAAELKKQRPLSHLEKQIQDMCIESNLDTKSRYQALYEAFSLEPRKYKLTPQEQTLADEYSRLKQAALKDGISIQEVEKVIRKGSVLPDEIGTKKEDKIKKSALENDLAHRLMKYNLEDVDLEKIIKCARNPEIKQYTPITREEVRAAFDVEKYAAIASKAGYKTEFIHQNMDNSIERTREMDQEVIQDLAKRIERMDSNLRNRIYQAPDKAAEYYSGRGSTMPEDDDILKNKIESLDLKDVNLTRRLHEAASLGEYRLVSKKYVQAEITDIFQNTSLSADTLSEISDLLENDAKVTWEEIAALCKDDPQTDMRMDALRSQIQDESLHVSWKSTLKKTADQKATDLKKSRQKEMENHLNRDYNLNQKDNNININNYKDTDLFKEVRQEKSSKKPPEYKGPDFTL